MGLLPKKYEDQRDYYSSRARAQLAKICWIALGTAFVDTTILQGAEHIAQPYESMAYLGGAALTTVALCRAENHYKYARASQAIVEEYTRVLEQPPETPPEIKE